MPSAHALPDPTAETTVEHAREWLAQNRSKGASCPVCDRPIKQYDRPLNTPQVIALAAMYLDSGTGYVNVRELRTTLYDGIERPADRNNEISKLAHWGLAQQHPDPRRGGWWRVTALGEKFLRGEVAVPRSVVLYLGEYVGVGEGEVCLSDVLGRLKHPFSLGALLTAIAEKPRHDPGEDAGPMFAPFTVRRRRARNGTVAALGDGTPDEELFAEIAVAGQDEFADHPLRPEDTVQAAREWVEEVKGGAGGQCPVCGRVTVIKQYDITPDQAKLLIHMYRRCGTTYVNVREFEVGRRLADHNNLVAKMAVRGLLKGKPGKGGKGTYRLTEAGVRWVLNREGAPAILSSYNRYGETVTSEHTVFISEVLRANRRRSVTGHQTYEELMAGVEGFAPPAPDPDENWMHLAS